MGSLLEAEGFGPDEDVWEHREENEGEQERKALTCKPRINLRFRFREVGKDPIHWIARGRMRRALRAVRKRRSRQDLGLQRIEAPSFIGFAAR